MREKPEVRRPCGLDTQESGQGLKPAVLAQPGIHQQRAPSQSAARSVQAQSCRTPGGGRGGGCSHSKSSRQAGRRSLPEDHRVSGEETPAAVPRAGWCRAAGTSPLQSSMSSRNSACPVSDSSFPIDAAEQNWTMFGWPESFFCTCLVKGECKSACLKTNIYRTLRH